MRAPLTSEPCRPSVVTGALQLAVAHPHIDLTLWVLFVVASARTNAYTVRPCFLGLVAPPVHAWHVTLFGIDHAHLDTHLDTHLDAHAAWGIRATEHNGLGCHSPKIERPP